jgi:hypothetical protein
LKGPFDGVIAFFSGAALAASLLIAKEKENSFLQRTKPVFKCAIFFSGGIPATIDDNKTYVLNPEASGQFIKVPTVHIWGANDKQYPCFGPVLYDMCAEDL